MTEKNVLKPIILPVVIISIVIPLLTAGNQVAYSYTYCYCDNCKQEWKEARDLITLAKFDQFNQIASKIQTDKELAVILDALDPDTVGAKRLRYGNYGSEEHCHERYKEARTSLDILTALLRHSEVPREMTKDKVIQSLRGFIDLLIAGDTIQYISWLTLDKARWTLWCAEIYIFSGDDKNAALLEAAMGPDVFKRRVALDMLIDVDYKYESIIEKLRPMIVDEEKHGLREYPARIQNCIKTMELRQSLKGISDRQKCTLLNELFNEYAFKKRGWGTNEFVLWIITEIKHIGDKSAIEGLKRIWKDESYEWNYRAAAEGALIDLGAISPEERLFIPGP